ncbi:hypothetical protein GRJ2_000934600 [Grus japonensis]|uniref:Uncharacterized protein n=1 Tax=Grus japonensis TaxID=30415 RepID=A0ABC9WGV8_GRUJA
MIDLDRVRQWASKDTMNHRIIEYPELEGTHKDHQSNSWLHTGPAESEQMTESIIQTLLELSQARRCDHFPGEPVPVPNHPLSEEPFPDIQPKPPPSQLHSIPSGSITGHQRKEISACPFAPPREEVVGRDEVSPQSPL